MRILENGEKVVTVFRKHWFVFVIELILLLVLAASPFLLLILAEFALPFVPNLENQSFNLFTPLTLFFMLLWLLFFWTIIFVVWTNYYLDSVILTNKRVIDIDQRGLFSRDIATTALENVQDVKIEMFGFIPTILGYGNLQIHTAGPRREMYIRGIRRPQEVKSKILDAHERSIAAHNYSRP